MLKAPIAQALSTAAQPHVCTMEVANGVWSGRVRVLETSNEATERKWSKARDARAAGAAARVGRVRVTQCEREGERERWMDGSEISRTPSRGHNACGCRVAQDLKTVRFFAWERSLLHNTFAAR